MEKLTNYKGSLFLLGLYITLPIAIANTLALAFSDVAILWSLTPWAQAVGTAIMLSLLPGYLVAAYVHLHRATLQTVAELAPLAEAESDIESQLAKVHSAVWLLVPLLIIYSSWQNRGVFEGLYAGLASGPIDYISVLSSWFLWTVIAYFLAWRIPVTFRLRRFAAQLKVDLFDLNALRPLTNLAAMDVLVIAGGMAFMPLQSLDAELRWINYEGGVYIGVPSAILLLVIPLMGARVAIMSAKEKRLAVVQTQIESTSRDDVVQFETLLAHKQRIEDLPNWPFDANLTFRLLGYAVIAPLAWVGAALVENIVDQIAGG